MDEKEGTERMDRPWWLGGVTVRVSGLVTKLLWVRFSVGQLSSYLGQLSLPSLRGR